MIETAIDTRAMIDRNDFAVVVDLRTGVCFDGVLDHNHDLSMDINGRRTGVRLVNDDADQIPIGQVLDIGDPPEAYTVRAKEQGARTTLLVLEQA